MTIALTREQLEWLEAAVAEGRFASIDEGVQAAVQQLIVASALDDEDDDWVLPLIEEARRSLDRGEGMTLEEFKARNAARRSERGG